MINVHVYPSPLLNESRILRITQSLAEHGIFNRIVVVGVHQQGLAERERLDAIRDLLRIRAPLDRSGAGLLTKVARTLGWSARVLWALRRESISCVNCHSLAVLPLCAILAAVHRARLVYDTHELETETIGARGFRQTLSRWVERVLVRRVDAIAVVSQPIADWYRSRYPGIPVTLVRNTPKRVEATSRDRSPLRAATGIAADMPLFLYQGVFGDGRGLDVMFNAFAGRTNAHLVLLGYGPRLADVLAAAEAQDNVHYHPAVEPHDLLRWTAGADVGLCVIEPLCLSYQLSLPNKLFEYVAAGVPVLASDLPAIREVVTGYSCGWLCQPETAALRERIDGLTAESVAAAARGTERVRRELVWETEEPELLALYHGLDVKSPMSAA